MFTQTAEFYDAIYSWLDYEDQADKLHALIEQRVPGAHSLLDVACGTGRHLELLRRWYSVEGLDLDPRVLDIARRRLPGVPLHVGDMREFDLGSQFDVVTCLFSSIGAMTTFDDLVSALTSMARHLAPGGLLIVDPWLSPEQFEPRHLPKPLVASGEDFHIVRMSETRLDGRISSVTFHYLLGTPGHVEYFTETLELAVYTHKEYRDAFVAAGLSPEFDEEGPTGRGRWVAQRRNL